MAAPSTYMDYDEVARLADTVATAAGTLGDGRVALDGSPAASRSAPAPYVPAWNAFGNTDSAADCSRAHHDLKRAALAATAHLRAVLDADDRRLRDTVTCFQETDHASADRLCAAAGTSLNVYSTHVHSGGTDSDDALRAGQIDEIRERVDGPAVIGGDLNAELDDGDRSAEAIAAFEEEGFGVYGGGLDEDGEIVGTSSGGRTIDYVITTPGVVAGQPELIDTGGLSDHHGQRTDITVHGWG